MTIDFIDSIESKGKGNYVSKQTINTMKKKKKIKNFKKKKKNKIKKKKILKKKK